MSGGTNAPLPDGRGSQGRGSQERGAAGDPFEFSRIEPDAVERVVAGLIWGHRGRKDPITITQISAATGRDERTVKGVVEQLVITHEVLIGASRERPYGYYVVCDAEDLEAACGPLEAQAKRMFERLSRLRKMAEARGICGQTQMGET